MVALSGCGGCGGCGDAVPAACAMASDRIRDARDVAMSSGPPCSPLVASASSGPWFSVRPEERFPGSMAVTGVPGSMAVTGVPGSIAVTGVPGSMAVTSVPGSGDKALGTVTGSRASSLDTDAVSDRDPALAGDAGGGPGTVTPRSPLETVSASLLPVPGDVGVTSAPSTGGQSGDLPGWGTMAGGLTGEEMTSERRLLRGDRG